MPFFFYVKSVSDYSPTLDQIKIEVEDVILTQWYKTPTHNLEILSSILTVGVMCIFISLYFLS